MPFLTVEAALFPELCAEAKGPPIHGVQYIGNKRQSLDWIRAQVPDGVTRVVDAFSGGGSVSYMFKREGYHVIANDSLKWPWHIARATVVNQGQKVSEDEVKALLEPNPKAGSWARTHYKGKFWKPGVHQLVDEIRENVDALKGFKRDIALAALGATMLSARGTFPQFTVPKIGDRAYTPKQFKARYAQVIQRLNSMVFKGPKAEARCLDVRALLKTVKADAVYFDPPYVSGILTHNYSYYYHAVEAVMVKGEGRSPDPETAGSTEKTQESLGKKNIGPFFEELFAAAEHIPTWLLSYRDAAFPSEKELKELITAAGREVDLQSREHEYTMAGTKRGGAPSKAKELLFIGRKGKQAKNTKQKAPAAAAKATTKEDPRMKVPSIQLAAQAASLPEDYWTGEARAIVAEHGWPGLALACAVVDADHPGCELEDGLPKVFEAYHLPVMQRAENGELKVLPAVVDSALATLADAAGCPRLPAQALSLAEQKLQSLKDWGLACEAVDAFASLSEEETQGVAAPPAPVVPEGNQLLAIAGSGPRVLPMLSKAQLVAVAAKEDEEGDHAIKFILCHAGTNKNGDHFTADELKKAVKSAAGVKINLKHGQQAQDIVGKTEKASFEDTDGGRIVCAGRLFTKEDELAAKARRLIKENIITKVSMECSYTEGECSVCGETYKNFDERCEHLKESKGGTVDGKEVYAILKGVTFSGAGLLEGYEPADPRADITSMAWERDGRMHAMSYGIYGPNDKPESMKEVLNQEEIREDLWKTQDAFRRVTDSLVMSFVKESSELSDVETKLKKAGADFASRVIQILKSINTNTDKETAVDKNTQAKAGKPLEEMTQEELLAHTKQLQEKADADEKVRQEAEAKAAAETLVQLMEKKGREFEKAEAREAEVTKLAAMTEEARQAVTDTWSALPDKQVEDSAAAAAGTARANAEGAAPTATPDGEPQTLGQKLAMVCNASYEAREGMTATESK